MNIHKKPAKYFLVQRLGMSYRDVLPYFRDKRITINGKAALANQPVYDTDAVELDGKPLQLPKELVYLAFHKPRGIESTLNKEIPCNLTEALTLPEGVFPVGRLDKESEGLLLLTNDGMLYKSIANSKEFQEKEYLVEVNKELTEDALFQLATGIKIMGQMTRPAKVTKVDGCTFKIVLTQGLNRQIRRMCYKLGYEVTTLRRLRIVNIELGNLGLGEVRSLEREEVVGLNNIF
jgi:23S rRNA pseudouridine2604 synthase